mgnify:CR=1 FL=1
MIWNEIVCLGDSITFGARDEYGRCYPAELGKLLTKELNEFYYCHNFGINGETSSDLQKRAWNNISSKSNSNIMLLLIGTNDTQIGVTPDIFISEESDEFRIDTDTDNQLDFALKLLNG